MKYQEYQFNSFRLLTIKTNHFKNCHIEINFLDDLDKVNMALRSFLVTLLSFTTKKYPSKREMMIALEELYNGVYFSSCSKLGNTFISSFSYDFLNPKFIKEKDYLENCLKFLCESLFEPDIENDAFKDRNISIIKDRIISKLDEYKENALSNAMYDSINILFADSLTSKRISGNKEEVMAIDGKSLYAEYQKLITDCKVDILISGDLDMDEVAKYMEKYFQKKTIVEKNYSILIDNPVIPFGEIEVPSIYQQTQLIMYYQYENFTDFERYYVSKLFNQILGQANLSDKLAYYLRVQNKLVYFCNSKFNCSSKYLTIFTGLKYENVTEAQKAIKKALKDMETGKIDPEYFEQQKENLIASIEITNDDQCGLLDNYFFHKEFNVLMPEETKEEIKKITINDLKKMAKKLKLTLTYIQKEASK